MFRSRAPKRTLVGLALVTALAAVLAACDSAAVVPAIGPATIGEDGVYRDAFIPGQTGQWIFEEDAAGSTSLVNEQLVVSVNTPNTMQFSALTEPEFSDFVLEVDAWQRSGPPESSYGVLFRMLDDQQFYRFDVTGNGLFVVERRNADGTWTRLVPEWTQATAINQGLNVANRLKIIAAGPDLAFYVNDILLTQVSDPAYASGRIALDAGTFSGNTLQVSFDNLTVTSDAR